MHCDPRAGGDCGHQLQDMSAGGGCGDHCQVQYICYGAGGDSQRQPQVVCAVTVGEFQGYGAAAAGARVIVSRI